MAPYHARIPDCHPDRKHHGRGLCEQCYRSPKLNPVKHKYQQSTYTDVHWGYRLKHFYGITPEDYDRLNEQQHGLCAICGQPPRGKMKRLSVDHDHTTQRVRGLLCITCNRALGYLENDDWRSKADAYRDRFSPRREDCAQL
jgi:hypothetical protein